MQTEYGEHIAFGRSIPVFCQYTMVVYTPYISGIQPKYPKSVFITVNLTKKSWLILILFTGFKS